MVQLRTWPEVEAHAARWRSATDEEAAKLPIGYLLSLEGADSILSWRHLEKSRADGLIALGPVHYGPGIYGHGTDDEGPLTPQGRELLKEMERLGIILDVTHLCDESFWDALGAFLRPGLGEPSQLPRAGELEPAARPTSRSRRSIERGAVIGMAFDAIMMVHGWAHQRSTPQDFGSEDREDLRAHRPHLPDRRQRAARRHRHRSRRRLRHRADADGSRQHRRPRDARPAARGSAATRRKTSTASSAATSSASCASI